jgi:hypothetical protein
MKHEYHEGAKAGENFEKLARACFGPPQENPKRPARKPTRGKKTAGDKG